MRSGVAVPLSWWPSERHSTRRVTRGKQAGSLPVVCRAAVRVRAALAVPSVTLARSTCACVREVRSLRRCVCVLWLLGGVRTVLVLFGSDSADAWV